MSTKAGGATVLLLMEDALLAAMLADSLEALGHQVVSIAATAEQAESGLMREPADVVLIDLANRAVSDPLATGKSLIDSSRAEVIYLAADSAQVEAVARNRKESGWVKWPFDPRDLDFEIRLTVDQGRACAKGGAVEAEPF